MNACPYCAAARDNPFAARFDAACRGCRVRVASNATPHGRDAMIAAEPEADREAFLDDMRAEFTRRQTWRRANPFEAR